MMQCRCQHGLSPCECGVEDPYFLTPSLTTKTYTNANMYTLNIVDVLKERIRFNNLSWNASDNISEIFKDDSERQELIKEIANRFTGVLDALLIDQENDPNSAGTAKRLAKMYVNEIMSGRYYPAPDVTAFPNDGPKRYTGMLVVRSEIKSMCSHHHQPVTGTCYIGVLPSTKVIGLSKYTRIAQWCARRGTLQEELCNDIADNIRAATESDSVGVYIQATHGCCENRGIMAHSSLTQTTVLHGEFHDASVKKEFFDNIALQERAAH